MTGLDLIEIIANKAISEIRKTKRDRGSYQERAIQLGYMHKRFK